MTVRLRYRASDAKDPHAGWGRSELVIESDGSARLEHHFPRGSGVIVRTGRIDLGAFDVIWSGLNRAGFPAPPGSPPAAAGRLRQLTMEEDGRSEEIVVGWTQARSLPGYADAFDVLDGVVRQLSGNAVTYPTAHHGVVHDIVAVSGSVPRKRHPRRLARSARWLARLPFAVVVFLVGGLLMFRPFGGAPTAGLNVLLGLLGFALVLASPAVLLGREGLQRPEWAPRSQPATVKRRSRWETRVKRARRRP